MMRATDNQFIPSNIQIEIVGLVCAGMTEKKIAIHLYAMRH